MACHLFLGFMSNMPIIMYTHMMLMGWPEAILVRNNLETSSAYEQPEAVSFHFHHVLV